MAAQSAAAGGMGPPCPGNQKRTLGLKPVLGVFMAAQSAAVDGMGRPTLTTKNKPSAWN